MCSLFIPFHISPILAVRVALQLRLTECRCHWFLSPQDDIRHHAWSFSAQWFLLASGTYSSRYPAMNASNSILALLLSLLLQAHIPIKPHMEATPSIKGGKHNLRYKAKSCVLLAHVVNRSSSLPHMLRLTISKGRENLGFHFSRTLAEQIQLEPRFEGPAANS